MSTQPLMLRPLTGADGAWLLQFLTTNDWPFHVEQPDRRRVAEWMDAGHFDGPGNETFVIEENLGSVGIARVFEIQDGTPLFDLRVGEEHRGRGLGSAVLRELVERVFTTHDVDRLEGTTRQDNVAMRHVFVSAGFVKEAHHREAWPDRHGTLHDAVGYAILRSDWKSGRRTMVDWNDETAWRGADRPARPDRRADKAR